MPSSRVPPPSLDQAARELRSAREVVAATLGQPHSVLLHRENVVVLRRALDGYVAALERDGLPVASKLRQELMLLGLSDDLPSRYRQDDRPATGDR